MKIAFFSTHVMWTRHYETQLEIMQRHLESENSEPDEIHEYFCDTHLASCDIMASREIRSRTPNVIQKKAAFCARCTKTRHKGVSLLAGSVIQHPMVSEPDHYEGERPRFFYETAAELRKIAVDGFAVGEGVASTLISATRNLDFDVHARREIIDEYIKSSLSLYYATIKNLRLNKYDKVYVFNGRFAHTKAILSACRVVGVSVCTYDIGGSQDLYQLFENSTPHDLALLERKTEEIWVEALGSEEEKAKIGAVYFTERFEGNESGWISFTKGQKIGELPLGWNKNRRNLVIYSSSDDEFSSVEGEGWKLPIYENQTDAIRRIVFDPNLQAAVDLQIYLRIHPNLKGLSGVTSLESMLRIKSDKLVVIPPESSVSSYRMLMECWKVLTFGSSMGVEATYWGKPSVLIGPALHRSCDATYNPRSHSEVIELILADLKPKPAQNALKYGFFFKAFGEEYRYFKPTSWRRGLFNGVNLDLYRDSYIVAKLKEVFRVIRRNRLIARFIWRIEHVFGRWIG